MPSTRIDIWQCRLRHKRGQKAHAAADLLYSAAQYDHRVGRRDVFQWIERDLDLTWTPFRFQNAQRQTSANQRLAKGVDDRLEMVERVFRHVLIAVAHSLDAGRCGWLGTICKAVVWDGYPEDVTFDFEPGDIGQPLRRQTPASGLHDLAGIKRTALARLQVYVAQHPAALMRPGQH